MITETFINHFIELIFAKKQHELEPPVYQDLQYFLQFAETELFEGGLTPWMKTKFEMLKKICEQRLKGDSLSEILASINMIGKFKQYLNLIDRACGQTMDEAEKRGESRPFKTWLPGVSLTKPTIDSMSTRKRLCPVILIPSRMSSLNGKTWLKALLPMFRNMS